MKKVAIIMGSQNDMPIMKKSCEILDEFCVPYTVRVISAHRTPESAIEFSSGAIESGYGVIIAGAGKSAHLAGVLASKTTLPIIGVPISASELDGMDALLSTVQMPTGVPVATVAINGSANAGLLAVMMLAIEDKELGERLSQYKLSMKKKVEEADAKINLEFSK